MGVEIRVAVLFPSYQAGGLEQALEAARRHLRGERVGDWFTVGPVPVDGLERLESPPELWDVPPDGRRGYNPLMLSAGLYKQLASYSHVLIYQPDAIVFSDELTRFASAPVDYIGAPHTRENAGDLARHALDPLGVFTIAGGNGGLSLRSIPACLSVLHGMPDWLNVSSYYTHIGMNEDLFWSFRAPELDPSFRVAPLELSLEFAWECEPALCWVLTRGRLPMGAHGFDRHDPEFWQTFGGVRRLAGLPERPEPAPSGSPVRASGLSA